MLIAQCWKQIKSICTPQNVVEPQCASRIKQFLMRKTDLNVKWENFTAIQEQD